MDNEKNSSAMFSNRDAKTIAREIVTEYIIIIAKKTKPGGHVSYLGNSVQLPKVLAKGSTPGKCYKATKETLLATVLEMIKSGKRPPERGKQRIKQVNVRLTLGEKMMLISLAKTGGFKGLADFLRNAVFTGL